MSTGHYRKKQGLLEIFLLDQNLLAKKTIFAKITSTLVLISVQYTRTLFSHHLLDITVVVRNTQTQNVAHFERLVL